MRTLAALSASLASDIDNSKVVNVSIDGVEASIGLIDLDDPCFEPSQSHHRHHVQVRVSAFSLNYRERYRLLSVVESEQRAYRVLGSEFVGVVEAVGDDVSHVRVGDRVVGDGCVDLARPPPV
ncbi:hypothetical protein CS022_21320 [Veronia nyctiphanis]|uniref:Alcohol dehydrogenase-like N-terminal domain-containing protein n=1 Tax=Veronia nyctiphanis TaxID=1278244 RepID=A0A4Q0YPW4_9GAMM|nr:alcohol dehydrogenase catalytic domain-containing protein [Veronia nyctiphanis]RXJ71209.1 hypothetical protein CS022_21320 [Veronia nyctiphanis]